MIWRACKCVAALTGSGVMLLWMGAQTASSSYAERCVATVLVGLAIGAWVGLWSLPGRGTRG
jgi:hypothetical protein